LEARAQGPRLVSVTLDEQSIGRGTPDQEHERRVAVYDLVESNSFGVPGHEGAAYRLRLALRDRKILLDISDADGGHVAAHLLSMTPFRRIFRDYFIVCESYFTAIRGATPEQIEAIDMGRRGLHDEGARLLAERLENKVDCDFDTARRLFTLITALHWKG
jgi:uncharacterized protein (UPF0262 family)